MTRPIFTDDNGNETNVVKRIPFIDSLQDAHDRVGEVKSGKGVSIVDTLCASESLYTPSDDSENHIYEPITPPDCEHGTNCKQSVCMGFYIDELYYPLTGVDVDEKKVYSEVYGSTWDYDFDEITRFIDWEGNTVDIYDCDLSDLLVEIGEL